MIDFKEMAERQDRGLTQIDSLEDTEKTIFKHFCSLWTEALMRVGMQRQAPFEEVVYNAFKNGLALGLELRIENGQVIGRTVY